MASSKEIDKEALKALRRERQFSIAEAKKSIREQARIIRAIKDQIKTETRTVPEIAQATGLSPDEVLRYVATLKKYGEILEGPKDGDYFRYQLVA